MNNQWQDEHYWKQTLCLGAGKCQFDLILSNLIWSDLMRNRRFRLWPVALLSSKHQFHTLRESFAIKLNEEHIRFFFFSLDLNPNAEFSALFLYLEYFPLAVNYFVGNLWVITDTIYQNIIWIWIEYHEIQMQTLLRAELLDVLW